MNRFIKKVYVSKSNAATIDDITAVVEIIEKSGNDVLQYIPGQKYNPNLIKEADDVIFVIARQPEGELHIGWGQHQELESVWKDEKGIFLFKDGKFFHIVEDTVLSEPQKKGIHYSWLIVEQEACTPEFINEKGE